MECLSINLPQKEARYILKNESQKNLIKMLLHHASMDLKYFAELLGVESSVLVQVVKGNDFLDGENFKRLVDWFFFFING
ncbi:hypothetical protein DGG96_19945 [Legionella qingyii]|uniref:XRE family transcriptional regulator n=1 Tax=Legionella qingyii TaxID=2184757 RepID=A0A317TZM2_9GAMM|nr:hypothetical protein [Legionella qingyii]PWY53886.1 hypothetical protein DGG96_19945 [Legionella qingyii]RUR24162.1 hypothetical protein ELY20_06280 [Legionella qingyii]